MMSVMWLLVNCWCLIYHIVTLSFGLPAQDPLNETEVAPNKSKLNAEVVSTHIANFFKPVTCRPTESQDVVPCKAGGYINSTLCLKNQCCVSSKKHILLDCYTPLEDRAQRILRLFGIGLVGVVLVGCLPCCCFLVEKSPCANPLRRAPKKEVSSSDSDSSDD